MADLFTRSGLEQETGLLPERWQQEGSVIINISGTYNNETIYTVTAGKKLYIKALQVDHDNDYIIKDGGSSGAQMFGHNGLSGGSFVFTVPLEFETDVYIQTTNAVYNLQGWEE